MILPTASRSVDVSDVAVRRLGEGDYERVAGWLSESRNARWLDFGPALGRMDALRLKLMAARPDNIVWTYGPACEGVAVGVVGLHRLDRRFGTAELWAVLGEKQYGSRDLTVRAVARLLSHGFDELGLRSIHAWTVESNRHSRRALERLGFRFFGRQRACHVIEGTVYDRLWFDMLADEFRGYGRQT